MEIAPRTEGMAGEKEMACCVRGYHVCIQGYVGSSNWGSASDRYAVAVLREETIIGHFTKDDLESMFPVCAKRRLYTLYSDQF